MLQTEEQFTPENKKLMVLVVDDELINREILGQILSEEYHVIFAEDGKKGLAAIRDHRNDLALILLDLVMPGIHGLDLLKLIKSNKEMKHIPVIVLTSDHKSEVPSLQLGASDFIPKPYPLPEIIMARVKRTIELEEDRKLIQSTEKDSLTGLYNREYFFRYAEQFDLRNKEIPMDAILVNINHFHNINERYGKEYGNTVLRHLADLIRVLLRKSGGFACRLEADTFLIYCRHGEHYKELMEQAASDFDDNAAASGNRFHLRMGVYPDVDKSIDIERRFDRAKMAADTGRNKYGQTISYYDNKLHNEKLYEEQLLDDFRSALEQRQFQVYYQPKFDVRKDEPVLASAEALVRWKHPRLGMIDPGLFIPLLEDNGLVQKLDHYVWQEAAAQIRRWKDTLGVTVPVSVNVSRVDMYDPELISIFKKTIEENRLTTAEYLLEITESAYTDNSIQIINIVKQLRKLGFRIEMDDFGTGYSSLNMLSMLPIDALKLDMKFIRTAFSERKDTRMIELIIDIAEYLKVPVIAEGVETEEQLTTLKALGCDIVQGYYFSRPVPAEEFETFIIQKKKQSEAARAGVTKPNREVAAMEGSHSAQDADAEGNASAEAEQKLKIVELYGIAHALSSDFERVYYVDLDTEEYTAFKAEDAYADLHLEHSGSSFFRECRKNLKKVIHPEDLEKILAVMEKKEVISLLDKMPVYSIDYRKLANGQTEYCRLKLARPGSESRGVVIGISNIHTQSLYRQTQETKLQKVHRDSLTYARIAQALAGEYFSIYYVNLDTNAFIEFSSTDKYKELQTENNGIDFFESCLHNAPLAVHEDDLDKVLYVLNKENMLKELSENGSISVTYRLVNGGKSVYANMKIILMEDPETESRHVVVGVSNIDAQIRREQKFAEAQALAKQNGAKHTGA
ncbi:MAG: EAL domain-containing protein [Succiniclasticum sp.]|nr:EAL domain-containing protein [Succiniclasticum sp.]